MAVKVGTDALPLYAHRFSPRKFTQSQLFPCLLLEQFFRTDYRGITAILIDAPALCEPIGLRRSRTERRCGSRWTRPSRACGRAGVAVSASLPPNDGSSWVTPSFRVRRIFPKPSWGGDTPQSLGASIPTEGS